MVYNNYDTGGSGGGYSWQQQLKNRLDAINQDRANNLGSAASAIKNSNPYSSGYNQYIDQNQYNQQYQPNIGSSPSGYGNNPPVPISSGGGGNSAITSAGANLASNGGGGGSSSGTGTTGGGTTGGGTTIGPNGEESTGTPTTNPNPATYSGGGTATINGNNQWYGDVLTAAQQKLQQDQDMQAYVYGKQAGLSDYWIQNLQNYVDPYAQYLAQNASANGAGPSTTSILDYSGGMYDYGLQKSADTKNNQFNPGQIVHSAMSAYSPSTADAANSAEGSAGGFKPSTLGSALYGNPDPGTQVQAVREFLGTALRGVVSDEVLGAYLKTIDQQGMQFVMMKNMSGNEKNNDNFGQYLQQKLGANGGF